MAFHSPVMHSIHDELAAFIKGIPFHPPAIPVISNTTNLPFPSDTSEIRQIMMAHLESPVYWAQNVQSLQSFGIGTFIEVGPRDILGGLISDISKEANCIKTCMPSAETLVLRNALAQLFASGYLNVRSKLFPLPVKKTAAGPFEVPSPPIPDRRLPLVRQTSDKLRDIVQKEINSFVLKCFGHFLRPRLLETIREEYDARFDEQGLDEFLKQMYPIAQAPGPVPGGTDEKSAVFRVPTTSPAADDTPGAPKRSSLDSGEVLDAVIDVIMQATGYDRDEIEPHMDLREDLSIRSSRLPVVMDALEGRFGIRIDIQDFIGVRTIGDVSERVAMLVARGGGCPNGTVEDPRGGGAPDQPSTSDSSREISRVVFRKTLLEPFESRPICISPQGSVAVLSTSGGRSIGKEAGDTLRRDYGVDVEELTFLSPAIGPNGCNDDLRTAQGRSRLIETIKDRESLAGLVLIVDNSMGSLIAGIEETFSLLCGFFELLNTILKSPAMKFVTVIDASKEGNLHTSPLVEGILGIFLCSAIEYDKMLFRVVRLEDESELRDAVRVALNVSIKPVELIYQGGRAFTSEGRVSPSAFRNPDDPNIGPEDVVICSGGGSGITPILLRSFIPFGCRLVLLGRTEVEPITKDRAHLPYELAPGERGIGPIDVREGTTSEPARCSEIRRTVEALNRAGLETSYVRCDVSDPEQTRKVVRDIAARFGKISGIVHGAGVIRDAPIHRMSPDDFSAVAGVKLLGAWNLFHAARSAGLKFFVCLSSAASIQGNPGQANYSAGNRAMSALMSCLHRDEPSITFKALMLPPISGAGMADNPDVRALLERTKASYVDVEELAVFFPHELLVAPRDEVKVMFMRSLPELCTAPRIVQDHDLAPNSLQAGMTGFKPEELPMLDTISTIDRREMTLIASRSFSQQKDLWLPEHKPFKHMEHPLLSAIMVLETLMEAARTLFPHLYVHGIRGAQFLHPVECPQGSDVSCEVSCRCVKFEAEEVVCDASLTASDLSPASLNRKRSIPNFRASILLGGSLPSRFERLDGFPVTREELNSRPMDSEQVRMLYQEGTDLKGRYRVIQSVDGASPDAIRGRMSYTQGSDFSTFSGVSYQYSPYLLEGLLHILNFHCVMRDGSEARSMIPCGIAEMIFVRKCAEGESFALEARLREQTALGSIWDARALDVFGKSVMHARRIEMRWC
jgi:NAD(P)-dependent dehydrogenase (short-subunit alcohol dehydrogenase family)/acyl carrier protein